MTIYTYTDAFNALIKFEGLVPNKREHSPHNIAVFITNDLENDSQNRFGKGIDHVRQQL